MSLTKKIVSEQKAESKISEFQKIGFKNIGREIECF
jgi:hypothetical protein